MGGVNQLIHIDLFRSDNSLWIGNFEGLASTVSANKGIYAKAFRVEPDALRKLHHLDIYGFANNHAMEHGLEAYRETVKALESYVSKVFGQKDASTIAFEHQG